MRVGRESRVFLRVVLLKPKSLDHEHWRTVLDDRTEFCSEEVRFPPDLKSTGTDQEIRVHAAGELAGYWPAGTNSAVIRRGHAGDYDRSKEKPAVVGAQNSDPHWRLAPVVVRKSAPEELIVIVLLPGSAGVGSRVERPVCGGAFRLAAVPVHRNGGRRFLRTVPWSIRRDRESVRFYVQWR